MVVSAASIVAKVVRDREITKLAKKYGEIGSGYPSDPVTIRWLYRLYRGSPVTTPYSPQELEDGERHPCKKDPALPAGFLIACISGGELEIVIAR